MSSETSAWAKEQTCGDRTVKAVLREIANWARPDGVVEFLSVKRIAEVVEVDPRTVRRALARLDQPTLEHPDRLGLIRRLERFRPDGGQSACGFALVGYQPPMGITPTDKMSPPDADVTLPHDNLSGNPLTPVSPLKRDKILPPSEPDGSDTPAADFPDGEGSNLQKTQRTPAKGHRLPEDWTPPSIDDLPPMAQALVRQWPSGAYEASCETFRLHFLSETRAIGRKSNWNAALGKWLINDHPKVMRDAKAGVSFARLAPAKASAAAVAVPQPVASKAREDQASRLIHCHLRSMLGEAQYDRWIAPCALLFDEPGLIVITGSEFASTFIEQQFAQTLRKAVRGSIGMVAEWVRFQVERVETRERESA